LLRRKKGLCGIDSLPDACRNRRDSTGDRRVYGHLALPINLRSLFGEFRQLIFTIRDFPFAVDFKRPDG